MAADKAYIIIWYKMSTFAYENMTLDIHLGKDNKVVMMSLTINN